MFIHNFIIITFINLIVLFICLFYSFQSKDIYNQCLWLNEHCTREEAVKVLAGKPDGTFLIRKSQGGQYALSIM